MRRYGAARDEVGGLVAAAERAGLTVVGTAVHPPLAGTDDDHAATIIDLLDVLPAVGAGVDQSPRTRSCGDPADHARLPAAPRHRAVARGSERAAPRHRRARRAARRRRDACGLPPGAGGRRRPPRDGRSGLGERRQRARPTVAARSTSPGDALALHEPPHMHTSMLLARRRRSRPRRRRACRRATTPARRPSSTSSSGCDRTAHLRRPAGGAAAPGPPAGPRRGTRRGTDRCRRHELPRLHAARARPSQLGRRRRRRLLRPVARTPFDTVRSDVRARRRRRRHAAHPPCRRTRPRPVGRRQTPARHGSSAATDPARRRAVRRRPRHRPDLAGNDPRLLRAACS